MSDAYADMLAALLKERDSARAENERLKAQVQNEIRLSTIHRTERDAALTALKACVGALGTARLELHCPHGNGGKMLHETPADEFSHGHRCIMCDENVDRNMETRREITAALALATPLLKEEQ